LMSLPTPQIDTNFQTIVVPEVGKVFVCGAALPPRMLAGYVLVFDLANAIE